MDLDRYHHHRSTSTSSSTNSTTTSELFICFTSRLSSSSSMKLTKSILSPGRAGRDQPTSLPTSLSRRLRTNGSLKGGQASPMFPSTTKKRGCGSFENPEPSSPKVTCIGQVRVKAKKKRKAKPVRSLSTRRSLDMSFRKLDQQQALANNDGLVGLNQERHTSCSQSQECFQQHHKNQRWVHFPTICEALRAFGAEFSCLFPCRPSCFSTNERGKDDKRNGSNVQSNCNSSNDGQNSCGAVLARWFVALQDGECGGGGKGREIELVVGGGDHYGKRDDAEEPREKNVMTMRSSRRHVFEDLEIKDDGVVELKGGGDEGEQRRVSVCIPPKNALLLMRCRSDPMKMATLTSKFWECRAPPKDDEEEEDEDLEQEVDVAQVCEAGNEVEIAEKESEPVEEFHDDGIPGDEKQGNLVKEGILEVEVQEKGGDELQCSEVQETEKEVVVEEETELKQTDLEEEYCSYASSILEFIVDQENAESKDDDNPTEDKSADLEEIRTSHSSSSVKSDKEALETEAEEAGAAAGAREASGLEEQEEEKVQETDESTSEKEAQDLLSQINEENSTTTQEKPHLVYPEEHTRQEQEDKEEASFTESKERDHEEEKVEPEKSPVLPDCLLLMMCEPKLSMEVSKETWVCSTDFIRWLPERPSKHKQSKPPSKNSLPAAPPPAKLQENEPSIKKRNSIDSKSNNNSTTNQCHVQPPRNSCSLPAAAAAASMASMIEQKLVNAVGYEPFVLTRCKSEPMRTAAKLAAPDTCFWKNRKLEPLRRATFGIGAAGVGC